MGEGAFPCLNEFFHGREWLEKKVEVIRHDDPGFVDVALALEFHEDAFHQFAGFGLAEEAGACACIEPFFEPLGEAAVELEFRFLRPWLWVLFQKNFTTFHPLCELGVGEGIAETEGDELHHAVLLPMGKFGAVLLDFFGGIEEIGHGIENNISCRCDKYKGAGASLEKARLRALSSCGCLHPQWRMLFQCGGDATLELKARRRAYSSEIPQHLQRLIQFLPGLRLHQPWIP